MCEHEIDDSIVVRYQITNIEKATHYTSGVRGSKNRKINALNKQFAELTQIHSRDLLQSPLTSLLRSVRVSLSQLHMFENRRLNGRNVANELFEKDLKVVDVTAEEQLKHELLVCKPFATARHIRDDVPLKRFHVRQLRDGQVLVEPRLLGLDVGEHLLRNSRLKPHELLPALKKRDGR